MSTIFSYFLQKFNKITPQENNFTKVLENIVLMPKILYYIGDLPKCDVGRPKCVAIVGARNNTSYGEEVAYKMAYELARRGVVIVSGLAYGIDSIAHRAALDAGGLTVAVLGTPIDEIYPRAHEGLADEICKKGGAIISEYAPGEKIYPKTSFLARNRIISGLSDAVVVVEAAARSGTLNTAMHALDQGKDLFAVPGDIYRPFSVGCNALIRQGAMPYTGVEDIFGALFPGQKKSSYTQKVLCAETKEELAVLKEISRGVRDGVEIINNLKMTAASFNQAITMLEINGVVKSLGMNRWALKN